MYVYKQLWYNSIARTSINITYISIFILQFEYSYFVIFGFDDI